MVNTTSCVSVCTYLEKSLFENFQEININKATKQDTAVAFRAAIMNAVRKHGKFGYAEIGRYFGKSHATVIHAMKNHETYLKSFKSYVLYYKYCVSTIKTLHAQKYFISNPDQTYLDHVKILTADIEKYKKTIIVYRTTIREEVGNIKVADYTSMADRIIRKIDVKLKKRENKNNK